MCTVIDGILLDESRNDDEDEEPEGEVAEAEDAQEVDGLSRLPLEPNLSVVVEREGGEAEDDPQPKDVTFHFTHFEGLSDKKAEEMSS